MSRLIASGAILVVLLASIPAVSSIPFGPFLGLDFQNLDAFHDCIARNNPYLSSGAACGDVGARDMYYPPLLYWSFAWTRLLPFTAGALLWAAVVLGGVLMATFAWVPQASRGMPAAIFIGLLAIQYPALFAMERGNNDVLVLVLWTAAMVLYASGRVGWSGLLAGVGVALKLYPAFAAVVVGCGLIWWAWRDRAARRQLVLFATGGIVAVAVAVLVLFDQTQLYLSGELGVLATATTPLSAYTHALGNIAPGGVSWFLAVPLLAVWVVASARRLPDDPTLVFAGALAISTYYSKTSYDYNLITVYPLLVLLFVRVMAEPRSLLALALLLFGLVERDRQQEPVRWFDLRDAGAHRASVAVAHRRRSRRCDGTAAPRRGSVSSPRTISVARTRHAS